METNEQQTPATGAVGSVAGVCCSFVSIVSSRFPVGVHHGPALLARGEPEACRLVAPERAAGSCA
jgi:hypothetical protein